MDSGVDRGVRVEISAHDLKVAFKNYCLRMGIVDIKEQTIKWMEFYGFIKKSPSMRLMIQMNKESVTPGQLEERPKREPETYPQGGPKHEMGQ